MRKNRAAGYRRAPQSGLPRTRGLLGTLAHWHDLWLSRRTHARWRRELKQLDPRILDDIGLTRASIDDACRVAERRDSEHLRDAAETTIPPQYHRGLAKVAHHIEA